MSKKTLFSLLLLVNFLLLNAYNYLPVVKGYEKADYGAQRQNWDIEIDSKGIVYFANDEGLLRNVFGQWELAHTTHNDIVRSLCISNDTIWAAGENDYGFFVKNSPERLDYHLLGSIDEGIVWDIEIKGNFVYYEKENSVIVYDKTTKQSYIADDNNGFWDLVLWKDKVWTIDRKGNIGYFDDEKFVPVTLYKEILQWEIRTLFVHQDELYVLVFDGRIFKYDGQQIQAVVLPQEIAGEACFSAQSYSDHKILLGSITKGLLIVDLEQGIVEERVSRQNELLDNTVLAIAKDLNGNVWLGLDYGISFVEIKNPLRSIFNGGATYAIVDHNETCYLATNKGLFYAKGNAPFRLLEESSGQVWRIRKILGGDLFMS